MPTILSAIGSRTYTNIVLTALFILIGYVALETLPFYQFFNSRKVIPVYVYSGAVKVTSIEGTVDVSGSVSVENTPLDVDIDNEPLQVQIVR